MFVIDWSKHLTIKLPHEVLIMATNRLHENQETVLGVRDETACRRCGTTVSEFCMDVLDGLDEPHFVAHRCVQCAEVVDPVVLRNRRSQRHMLPYAVAPGTNCGI